MTQTDTQQEAPPKVETKAEWVEEVPPRGGGGGQKGSGKYAAIVMELNLNPGAVMKLGPYSTGAASGAVARLKELGVQATSRSIEGTPYVYTWAETEADVLDEPVPNGDAPQADVTDEEWMDEGGPFEEE